MVFASPLQPQPGRPTFFADITKSNPLPPLLHNANERTRGYNQHPLLHERRHTRRGYWMEKERWEDFAITIHPIATCAIEAISLARSAEGLSIGFATITGLTGKQIGVSRGWKSRNKSPFRRNKLVPGRKRHNGFLLQGRPGVTPSITLLT